MDFVLPFEIVDKCLGSRIWIKAQKQREVVGTLCGFDADLNMVLSDVIEYQYKIDGSIEKTHLDEILLNGGQITFLVPFKNGPDEVLNKQINQSNISNDVNLEIEKEKSNSD
ncbi:u6 snRNA-associated sm-like protein lsm5 [Anaeramoeba ignava]|uniref:U6 snRNA-associated sm-like protein lsm5 n=1 Tax=Anaeramoeba ignava TaxID=1746090 RepID=A0A9Q0RAL2_ANAIG|nr:u6 snRNA-associated sm-like protein lsm5 [Anaeramoeba ignava]